MLLLKVLVKVFVVAIVRVAKENDQVYGKAAKEEGFVRCNR